MHISHTEIARLVGGAGLPPKKASTKATVSTTDFILLAGEAMVLSTALSIDSQNRYFYSSERNVRQTRSQIECKNDYGLQRQHLKQLEQVIIMTPSTHDHGVIAQ
jgi:hypothetical protein